MSTHSRRMPKSYDDDISRQPGDLADDETIPRHKFTAAYHLHRFPLDMAMITCPDCDGALYPSDLGEALDWALGHQCAGEDTP